MDLATLLLFGGTLVLVAGSPGPSVAALVTVERGRCRTAGCTLMGAQIYAARPAANGNHNVLKRLALSGPTLAIFATGEFQKS